MGLRLGDGKGGLSWWWVGVGCPEGNELIYRGPQWTDANVWEIDTTRLYVYASFLPHLSTVIVGDEVRDGFGDDRGQTVVLRSFQRYTHRNSTGRFFLRAVRRSHMILTVGRYFSFRCSSGKCLEDFGCWQTKGFTLYYYDSAMYTDWKKTVRHCFNKRCVWNKTRTVRIRIDIILVGLILIMKTKIQYYYDY